MESGQRETGPTSERPDIEVVPRRKRWGKVAAVVLVVVLIIAALAFFARRPNRAPTVTQTTANPAAPGAEDPITFTAQATDPDGDDLAYLWDFGDGTTGTGAQAQHAYALPGKFIALLTVSDGKGGLATSDGRLLRITVAPKASDIAPKEWCASATCSPGPVVAVLDADRWIAEVGAPVFFHGNASWAYAFWWNNSANHSEGGTYSLFVASGNATLFALFRYVWGDGTVNTSGTSSQVGMTSHGFASSGNHFVQLAVTYVNADLNPSTKTAFAGYTVRVLSNINPYASVPGPPPSEVTPLQSRFAGWVARALSVVVFRAGFD